MIVRAEEANYAKALLSMRHRGMHLSARLGNSSGTWEYEHYLYRP
jgi:hypothetical protein